MDIVKSMLKEGEEIISTAPSNPSIYIKRRLIDMIPLIIMWTILDAFTIYIIALQSISSKYWFIAIPIVGFNIIGIVSMFFSISRNVSFLDHIGYVLTNLGVYKYDDGMVKNVDVVYFDQITGLDNSNIDKNGVVVLTATKALTMIYFDDVGIWYQEIAKKLQELELDKK